MSRYGGSGEHSEDDGALGPLQKVHGFSVCHPLQAVAVHSNDLIPTVQPAVLYSCPLESRGALACGQSRKEIAGNVDQDRLVLGGPHGWEQMEGGQVHTVFM